MVIPAPPCLWRFPHAPSPQTLGRITVLEDLSLEVLKWLFPRVAPLTGGRIINLEDLGYDSVKVVIPAIRRSLIEAEIYHCYILSVCMID